MSAYVQRVVLLLLLLLVAQAQAQAAVRHSWVLLDNSAGAVRDALERARGYGVQEVQLSHDIIMDIDEIVASEAKASEIREYVDMAHAANVTAVVWAHEFNDVALRDVCFDPDDPLWDRRRAMYRAALELVPQLDGVVLMYGSSELEPWYAPCLCDFCMANETVPREVRPWYIPSKVERIEQITRMVHGVVTREFGKKLILRNFIHRPSELEWMQQAIGNMRDIVFEAMSKDVPQDFEPYYPTDPLFGAAPHTHIMEVDVAGEYWGKSILPFFAPAYIERRLRDALPRGMTGYTARVSRYADSAFGTPNEGNLLALQRLLDSPARATADTVAAEFVARRYGVDAATREGDALVRALTLTYDIGRKMYYFLGFWALEKSSGLPQTLRRTELLVQRSVALYDADYDALFARLARPDVSVLADLRQEKDEAVALSVRAQALLAEAAPALPPADADDLCVRLRHQELCTRVWRDMAEAVWAYKMHRQDAGHASRDVLAGWIEAALAGMDAGAAQIEAELPAERRYPCDPAAVRALTADLRAALPPPAGNTTVPAREQLVLSPPLSQPERLSDTSVRLAFTSDRNCLVRVDYGTKVPNYGRTAWTSAAGTEHTVVLDGLAPDQWTVFRAVAVAVDGAELVRGSDYWLILR